MVYRLREVWPSVPELTSGRNIKLNARVSLRRPNAALSSIAPDIAQRPGVPLGEAVGRSYSARRLRSNDRTCSHMTLHQNRINLDIWSPRAKPAWAQVWHLWTVIIPRRSTNGRLLSGRVWRRHDGRSWIYKRCIEFDDPGELA